MLEGKNLGPFAIEKEIGSGAMGTVYRARYTKNNQLVAIKLMIPSLGGNDTALARFEQEAAILKQLNHPNIVRLYATGRYRRAPFYAMEYVEGESLDKVLARKGRFTWEEVLTLGQQLCAGLHHAHEQGIVHRDIKPSNLMILPNGTLKLTDFGIARDLDQTHLTSTHSTVGTAAYMSPEQCRGERNISHKSDIYSTGIVFYELLIGRKPFQAETPIEMFQMHVHGSFERPSRLVLDIPIWFDTLICQMMEKTTEHRPCDAAVVSESLGRIMEKVQAQQSAGVEAVKARVMDRPHGAAKPNEEDREAARELRSAMGKKRGRRRGARFYRSVWFQAAGILAVLGVTISLLFLAFRPPSPERLYHQAQKLMETNDPEKRYQAREGPIAEFLERYPEHEQAKQVREWAHQIDIDEAIEGLHRRVRMARNFDRPYEPRNDSENLASQALRYEDFGDLSAALNRWQAVLEKPGASQAERTWALLATRRSKELTAKLLPDHGEKEAMLRLRRTLIQGKLIEAAELKSRKKTRESRLMCQDVIDLYHDDPGLEDLVKEARALKKGDSAPMPEKS